MNRWRQEIETNIAAGDSAALDVLLAVGRFNSMVRKQGPRRKVAETLYCIGEEACLYCDRSIGAGSQFAYEWRAAFQDFLDSSGIKLEIVLALERTPFDMDWMVADDPQSTGRSYVTKPLSWAIRDKTTPVPRVLHHARVTTA